MEIIVISIGALAKNPLWNERVPTRTSHATTTLIRIAAGEKQEQNILVDPSLPGDILEAKLYERAGIHFDAITHVFLTNWRPIHRRGIEKFSKAIWWMHEVEIQSANEALDRVEQHAAHQGEGGRDADAIVQKERALLERVQPAPDELGEGVQLYPLFGYTPGQCGLIMAQPTLTTIIAGDAVPTAAHFSAGQVFQDCYDLEKSKESMHELYELADVIIPGHDNMFLSPRAAGM